MSRVRDLLTDQVPPGDLELERGILGAALLDADAARIVAAELLPEDFLSDAHRTVFARLHALIAAGQGVDLLTLRLALTEHGELAAVGGSEKLALLGEAGASALLLPEYMERLRGLAAQRRLIALGTQLIEGSYTGASPAGLIDAMTAEAERLRQRQGRVGDPGWPLLDGADDWDFPEPAFAVEALLPLHGVSWWGGMPKRYKSLLLLYVCLAMACRRATIARHFAVLQQPAILYVAREDRGARLKARRDDILAAWGLRPARGAIRFLVRPHFDLLDARHVDWLRARCLRDGVTLLVLDTWTALSPAADPMAAEDQARLAAVVVQLAEDIAGGVVVVDHSRKNRPPGQPLSSADIYGPLQKWAAAEHIVMLEVSGDPRRIEVFVEGKDGETHRFFLTVSPRRSGEEKFTYAGTIEEIADAQRAVGHGNREAVFTVLAAASEALGVKAISTALQAKTLKLSDDTILQHVNGLIAAERATKVGKGKASRYFALRFSEAPSPENPDSDA